MKNSSYSIMIAAIIFAAAFAGVALIADENDVAAEGTGYTVTYKLGAFTYTQPAATGAISLKSLDELGATVDAGSTFVGWYLYDDKTGKADETKIYAVGSTFTPDKDTTFEAAIVQDKYVVTFTYADGTSILEKKDQVYNTSLTLPSKATAVAAGKVLEFREVDGEIFIGWALAEAPDVIVIDDSEKTVKVTGNADYVAVYAHDPIMTFIVDGTTIYKHTEYKAVLPTAPAKEGFTFVGWNDGTITVRDEELSTYVSLLVDDVVLTAVWEPAVYTVSFTVDGEVVQTQSVKHGETATEPKFIPAKDGYDFVCWSVSEDKAAYDFGTAVTGDMTVTAVFDETPAPAPTGLKNPTNQMLLIVLGTFILIVLAMMIWKREVIRAFLVKKLDKGNKGGSA